jgi:hypothetical protein
VDTIFAGEQTTFKRRECVGEADVDRLGLLVPVNGSWADATVILGYYNTEVEHDTLFVKQNGYLYHVENNEGVIIFDDGYEYPIPYIYLNSKHELIIEDNNPNHSYYRNSDGEVILKVKNEGD